jgi:peroxiredoxin
MTVICLLSGTGVVLGQQTGNPAPDFEVSLLGGETFRLSDHSGKVVMMFLFGNTCPSCQAAGPDIETQIYQAYKEHPYFVAVGLDTWNSSSSETSVTGFREATGITFPLAIMAGDVVVSFETTYDRLLVIDSEGVLVHKGLVVAANDINNTIEAINQSLAITGINLTGVHDGFKVYPNPAVDLLTIDTGGEPILHFRMFDSLGKQVDERSFKTGIPSPLLEISLNGHEPGVYFYSVTTERSSFTGKLMVQY